MFTVKFREFTDGATKRLPNQNRPLNGSLVWYGESARVSQANFADIGIGIFVIRIIGTGTEHFALGFEFNMDF